MTDAQLATLLSSYRARLFAIGLPTPAEGGTDDAGVKVTISLEQLRKLHQFGKDLEREMTRLTIAAHTAKGGEG